MARTSASNHGGVMLGGRDRLDTEAAVSAVDELRGRGERRGMDEGAAWRRESTKTAY